MTHDMTFCKAIDCPYRFNCDRHYDNHKFGKDELVSQAVFEHTTTKCIYFIDRSARKEE